MSTAPHLPATPEVHRRLVVIPAIASVALIALALPWHLSGIGMEFLPFLLGLVGGALGGMAFLNWTLGMRNQVIGTLIHLAAAIPLALALYLLTSNSGVLFDVLPEPIARGAFLLQMSAIPAAGWLLLGLVGRISAAVSAPSAKRPAAIAPDWVEATSGSYVDVPALTLTLRRLGWIIVGSVLIIGSVVVAVLIGIDTALQITVPRYLLIFVALLFAVPALIAFPAWCASRTVPCRIAFQSHTLTVTVAGESTVYRFADIDELTWAMTTDYARLELRSAGSRVDLLVGIAKAPTGTLPQLPPLRGRFERALIASGLERVAGKKTHLHVYRRPQA